MVFIPAARWGDCLEDGLRNRTTEKSVQDRSRADTEGRDGDAIVR